MDQHVIRPALSIHPPAPPTQRQQLATTHIAAIIFYIDMVVLMVARQSHRMAIVRMMSEDHRQSRIAALAGATRGTVEAVATSSV